jgi:hypothetical protein
MRAPARRSSFALAAAVAIDAGGAADPAFAHRGSRAAAGAGPWPQAPPPVAMLPCGRAPRPAGISSLHSGRRRTARGTTRATPDLIALAELETVTDASDANSPSRSRACARRRARLAASLVAGSRSPLDPIPIFCSARVYRAAGFLRDDAEAHCGTTASLPEEKEAKCAAGANAVHGRDRDDGPLAWQSHQDLLDPTLRIDG